MAGSESSAHSVLVRLEWVHRPLRYEGPAGPAAPLLPRPWYGRSSPWNSSGTSRSSTARAFSRFCSRFSRRGVLAMDSIIHYAAQDGLRTLETLADSVDQSMVFTFAPRTLPLAAMHAVGKFFPRSDRAPAIEPIAPSALMKSLGNSKALTDWHVGREHRVSTGFYTSQAMELVRAC